MTKREAYRRKSVIRASPEPGDPMLLDGTWGEPFSSGSSDPIQAHCQLRPFDHAFQRATVDDSVLLWRVETEGRVLVRLLVRNRPACPFFPNVDLKSRLRSRAHGREQIRVTRSKTALCVTLAVISPRERSSFSFAYSLYFDTYTPPFPSLARRVHDFTPDSRRSIERGKEISFLRPLGGESVIEAFRPIRGFFFFIIAARLPSNFGRS